MTEKANVPDSEISRAIDEVLAAEKDAGRNIEAASAAAEEIRHDATESAQRILATANRRIGAIHRKVAADLHAEIAYLRACAHADAIQAPMTDLDAEQLDLLAAAVAEWLTTDADD